MSSRSRGSDSSTTCLMTFTDYRGDYMAFTDYRGDYLMSEAAFTWTLDDRGEIFFSAFKLFFD